MHSRMRHLQFRRINRFRPVKQDVHIDPPRPFRHQLFASHSQFDSTQGLQQFQRRCRRLSLDRAIQKPRLLQEVHRLRLIERRHARHAHARISQRCNRRAQVLLPVPHIRSQRKINRLFSPPHSAFKSRLSIFAFLLSNFYFPISSFCFPPPLVIPSAARDLLLSSISSSRHSSLATSSLPRVLYSLSYSAKIRFQQTT